MTKTNMSPFNNPACVASLFSFPSFLNKHLQKGYTQARTLLGAPGIATSNKKLAGLTRSDRTLLGAIEALGDEAQFGWDPASEATVVWKAVSPTFPCFSKSASNLAMDSNLLAMLTTQVARR